MLCSFNQLSHPRFNTQAYFTYNCSFEFNANCHLWFFFLTDWEDHVLQYLRSCGRARSWNDKQRAQNLWTKKGYDLAYKACDCLCQKGHMRKDLDYITPADNENAVSSRILIKYT